MNILITGAEGFVGKNLHQHLINKRPNDIIMCCDKNTLEDLPELCRRADFVFHLAGVNRPTSESEFESGNRGFTETLLSHCRSGKKPPLLFSSSYQAVLDNPYGKSKKAAEEAVFAYSNQTASPVYVYRLPGIFGKWCRPDYNSVVATFCHNVARDLPIEIRDDNFELKLIYIDDVCRAFAEALDGRAAREDDFSVAEPVYKITLGALAETLRSFRQSRLSLQVPDLSDMLTRKLYSTYLSYLPDFSYRLLTHSDERGSFTEFLKTHTSGQVSLNVTKPGIAKGNHWHHTKTEKFMVVSGQGVIRFRKIGENEIKEYPVIGEALQVVDIPPGYVHSITNTGSSDLVTIMWADEIFDPSNPDTISESIFPGEA